MKFPNPMTLVDWALRKREPKKSHNDLWRELIANGEELHTRASSLSLIHI